jgi:hypothetical protein
MARKHLILLYSLNILFIVFISFLIFTMNILYKYANTMFIVFFIVLIIWLIIYIITSIKNVMTSRKYIRELEINKLKKISEDIKFKSIPFWIINFLVLLFLTISAVVGTKGILIFIIPISILFTYIILLGTSVFSISYIILLYKNNNILLIQLIFHVILQLCFVFDIIDMFYLRLRIKKDN